MLLRPCSNGISDIYRTWCMSRLQYDKRANDLFCQCAQPLRRLAHKPKSFAPRDLSRGNLANSMKFKPATHPGFFYISLTSWAAIVWSAVCYGEWKEIFSILYLAFFILIIHKIWSRDWNCTASYLFSLPYCAPIGNSMSCWDCLMKNVN